MNLVRRTAGVLKTRLYRDPRDFVQKLNRWGLTNVVFSNQWENEMRAAVPELPRLDSPAWDLDVCFLTGTRFWHQTAFCAWSLQRHSGRTPTIRVYDDGSLQKSEIGALTRLFPKLSVRTAAEMGKLLDDRLPVSRFPSLRRKWLDYPNIRKLIDVHLGSHGPKLVMDSDMLFFAPPDEILEWSRDPAAPLHMTESAEFYGYPREALEALVGGPLPKCLNVGILGLRSENVEWERVEEWTASLVSRFGDSYFLEQGLGAMLCATAGARALPAARYLVLPDPAEARTPTAVLHHYVNESRPLLFRHGWRVVAATAQEAL